MSDTAPFKVAAVQMVSGPTVADNLAAATPLVEQAAAGGARIVGLPEYFGIMGLRDRDKVDVREEPGAGPIQDWLAATAKRLGIWLIGGSVPLVASTPDKVRNSSLVYGPDGSLAARYDKIHLFSFEMGSEHYAESRTIEPGTAPVAFDTPHGRVGLSICYDLRFPELYRSLAPLTLIFVPSAFTEVTGRAHWEVLLRARAIENLAWVVAPAQGGVHANRRETHGNSMVIDPWGQVLARVERGPGVALAEIDPAHQARLRLSLPALDHRVLGR